MNFQAILSALDAPVIALAIMTLIIIATVIMWHRGKPGFDLSECVTDSVTGKISVEKIGFMTMLAIYTWGFVAQTIYKSLSEWYVTAGLVTFAGARLGSQWLATRPKAQDPTP